MTNQVTEEVHKLLYWFIDNGEKDMIIDNYPHKEQFCKTVPKETYRRILHGLFVGKMGDKTNCTDMHGEYYPIYRHLLLTYALESTNNPTESWLALALIYESSELLRRTFNVNTKQYKGGIRNGPSATEVRDNINKYAKGQIRQAAENLNAEGQACVLKAWIELYIATVYSYKNCAVKPEHVKISNFFNIHPTEDHVT